MTAQSPSEKVIERIADAEGTVPSALEEPLFETVDPEALDKLFESRPDGPDRSGGQVTFEYLNYVVTVTAEKRVMLKELARA